MNSVTVRQPPADRSGLEREPDGLVRANEAPAIAPMGPQLPGRHAMQQSKYSTQTSAYEITVIEARERERIARGLHDEIGQILTMARFKLGELRQAALPTPAAALFDELSALLTQASRAVRSTTFELSCPALQLGLQEALQSLAERLARETGLAVRVDGRLPAVPAPESVLAVVFRVVRELCLNVQKHAGARNVRITPSGAQGQLSICVSDDGMGFQIDCLARGVSRDGGFGLLSADAQMQAIGGRLEIESAPGQGTRATVLLPLPDG